MASNDAIACNYWSNCVLRISDQEDERPEGRWRYSSCGIASWEWAGCTKIWFFLRAWVCWDENTIPLLPVILSDSRMLPGHSQYLFKHAYPDSEQFLYNWMSSCQIYYKHEIKYHILNTKVLAGPFLYIGQFQVYFMYFQRGRITVTGIHQWTEWQGKF